MCVTSTQPHYFQVPVPLHVEKFNLAIFKYQYVYMWKTSTLLFSSTCMSTCGEGQLHLTVFKYQYVYVLIGSTQPRYGQIPDRVNLQRCGMSDDTRICLLLLSIAD